jgi:nucleoside-diphosphate-sugar epimerase
MDGIDRWGTPTGGRMEIPEPRTSMNVVLAGSNAPFAAPLAQALTARGHTVVTVPCSPGETIPPAHQLHSTSPDEPDRDGLAEVAARADVVILVAGLGPVASVVADSHILDVLLARMRPGAALLHTSTLAVFGTPGPDAVVSEDDIPSPPRDLQAQRASEIRVLAAADWLRTVVVRPGLVYGPDGGPLLQAAVGHAARQGVSRYVGTRDDNYPTVHLHDVVDLYTLLVESSSAHGIYHAASGGTTAGALATLIADHAGVDRVEPWTAAALETELGTAATPSAVDVVADRSRAVPELGWRPDGLALAHQLAAPEPSEESGTVDVGSTRHPV